jgi:hypothetical protein
MTGRSGTFFYAQFKVYLKVLYNFMQLQDGFVNFVGSFSNRTMVLDHDFLSLEQLVQVSRGGQLDQNFAALGLQQNSWGVSVCNVGRRRAVDVEVTCA